MGERESRGAPQAAGEEAREPKSSSSGVFSVRNIIIVVAGVAISAGLAILTVGGYIAPKIEEERLGQQVQKSETTDAVYLDSLAFFKLDPMIVNPAGSNGERYLKTTISLELNNPEVQAELEKRVPQIKNQINNILSSKSILQLQTNEDKEKLRRDILDRVNGMLVTGRITNVYLEEFVYQ
jgi:flagellar FliL protein